MKLTPALDTEIDLEVTLVDKFSLKNLYLSWILELFNTSLQIYIMFVIFNLIEQTHSQDIYE